MSAAFQIIPGVQSYDWGKTAANHSTVAQYAEATSQLNFTASADKPYAELWMGTHSTLPSRVAASNEELSSHLARNPALIGESVQKRFGGKPGELPFLFKILSIGKALSIQAHPDKTLAARLHKEKPNMYKDDNHKPEMAIALTPFRGFCGFRPLKEIVRYVDEVGEFARVVKPDEALKRALHAPADAQETKRLLRAVFAKLMTADETLVREAVTSLAKRYSSAVTSSASLEVDEETAKLVCTLNDQFPADVGVLCAFVLNVVHLTPGQAIFLKANEPHAYLDGDIVECMAASDNVVRAGLTPKARDVQVLVEMLTYDDAPSDEKRMQPQAFAQESVVYDPPIDEFAVVRTKLTTTEPEKHRPVDGPSLVIVTQGSGTLTIDDTNEKLPLQLGQVFFIGAQTAVTFTAADDKDGLIAYRAYVETA